MVCVCCVWVGEGEDRGTTWCFLVGHAKVQTATQLLQICSGLRENDSLECSADRQGASLDDKSRQIWSRARQGGQGRSVVGASFG